MDNRNLSLILIGYAIIISVLYFSKETKTANTVVNTEYFYDSIPYPVPGEPVELIKVERYYDTTAFNNDLDSALKKNPDTLKQVARPYTTEHKDTNFYIRVTSHPLKQSATLDSLWFAKMARLDSVVTKTITEYIPQPFYDTFLAGFATAIISLLIILGVL